MLEAVSGSELKVGDRVWDSKYVGLGVVIETNYSEWSNDLPIVVKYPNFIFNAPYYEGRFDCNLYSLRSRFLRKVEEESYVVECII